MPGGIFLVPAQSLLPDNGCERGKHKPKKQFNTSYHGKYSNQQKWS
jgi:hypothetical protein